MAVRARVVAAHALASRAAVALGHTTWAANNHEVEPFRDSLLASRAAIGCGTGPRRRNAPLPRPPLLGGHAVVAGGDGKWACAVCRKSSSRRAAFAAQRCGGSAVERWAAREHALADAGRADGPRHSRWVTGSIVWCARCGSYAEERAVGMSAPCKGPPSTASGRRTCLSRLRQGLHPKTKEPLRGRPWPEPSVWRRGEASASASAAWGQLPDFPRVLGGHPAAATLGTLSAPMEVCGTTGQLVTDQPPAGDGSTRATRATAEATAADLSHAAAAAAENAAAAARPHGAAPRPPTQAALRLAALRVRVCAAAAAAADARPATVVAPQTMVDCPAQERVGQPVAPYEDSNKHDSHAHPPALHRDQAGLVHHRLGHDGGGGDDEPPAKRLCGGQLASSGTLTVSLQNAARLDDTGSGVGRPLKRTRSVDEGSSAPRVAAVRRFNIGDTPRNMAAIDAPDRTAPRRRMSRKRPASPSAMVALARRDLASQPCAGSSSSSRRW